jgi:WD40 repeat protein
MLATASGWSPIQAAAASHAPEPRAKAIQSHVRIWDVRSGRELANAALPGVTTSAAIAPDESAVAAIANDGTLRVWALPPDLGRAVEPRSLGRPSHVLDTGSRDARVLFSANSSRIGIVGRHGSVFDLRSASAIFQAGPGQTTVGFDAGMTRVFVEGQSQDRLSSRFSLLDTGSGRVVHQVDSLHGTGSAMTSDGRWAAAENRSDGGGSAIAQLGFHISEIATAKRVVSTGVGNNKEITAMTFSPDGTHLATASLDETARIWDTSVGAEAARFAGAGTVNAVAFSADGRILAVGTETGSAAVYLWKPADLVAQACTRLTRNLNKPEWQQFLGEVEYRATCNDLPLDSRPR